jgi:hypothetical protein
MSHVRNSGARPSLAALGLQLSEFFERWFPDAFALALAAVAIVLPPARG